MKGIKQLEVTVVDNGAGFEEKMLNNIFKPFQTNKEDGMGMGLCCSHSISENYGGQLSVTNLAEGGGCVKFVLPATKG